MNKENKSKNAKPPELNGIHVYSKSIAIPKNGSTRLLSKCIVNAFSLHQLSFSVRTDSPRPWDAHNDISTYENNFVVCTRTRHRAHNLNQSSNQSNSNHQPVRQSSVLTRGPSPSLNNVGNDDNQANPLARTTTTSTFLNSTEDIASTLKRLETTLTRTNERLDAHQAHLDALRNTRLTIAGYQLDFLSPYLHFLLIILVAIILKYI